MKLERLIEEYLKELQIRAYATGTISYRKIYLYQFLSFLNRNKVSSITNKSITLYQISLTRHNLSPLSIHSKLSALHCFLSWLYKKGYLFLNLPDMIHFPKKHFYLPKRILSEHEMKYFLSLPDTRSSKGTRDRAILELLYSTGIRRAELTGLDIFDLNVAEKTMKVLGKGKHERIVPVGRVAMQWVRRYLDKVRVNINTVDPALFIDMNCFNRMKVTTINYIIGEYNRLSGLKKRVTPHVFRHTCATHLLKNGADIRYIQELLGHASPATTQIYTRVVIKDLKEVYMRTHPRANKK